MTAMITFLVQLATSVMKLTSNTAGARVMAGAQKLHQRELSS
jgi:hypothetical protein